LAPIFVFAGLCNADDRDVQTDMSLGAVTEDARITDIRTALIELVSQDKDRAVRSSAAELKNAPCVVSDGYVIQIGEWRCNLMNQSFKAKLYGVFCTITLTGKFETIGGRLNAVVSNREAFRLNLR
jgi:hypothetical protein